MVTLEQIMIDPASIAGQVDGSELFGDGRPFELEIGCGKGGFLLRQARAHPERNYLGIEWANEFYKYTADRMARWGVTNVRLLRTDAKHFVMHRLRPACLAALHIYHPDPWPKKRHHKRRLITGEFIDAAIQALTIDGRLAIQTDHEEYFDQIRTATTGRTALIPTAFEDAEYGTAGERTESNFEIKYVRAGRVIHRLAFRRGEG